jgi:EAL domain-containing protein (putative c-di-GMP-specific phosphodiesterase class I)
MVYGGSQMNDSGEGLTINLDIDEALQQGALTVYYQPVFDISTAHPILVEAEALVRWNHPKLGMLTPTDFAIWHTSERITTNLTEYVLQHLVEQQVAWKKQNLTLPVAVNMSVAMISGDGFSQRLAVLLDEHRVDHASLILELADQPSAGLSGSAMQSLDRLRQVGFSIILDNFGQNPVFLSELPALPLAGFKLDAGLIADLATNERSRQLVGGIIDLAHNLSVPVYTKSVETLETLSLFKSLGCDKAQGWLLGKPMPASELTQLLVEQVLAPVQPEAVANFETEVIN